MEPIVNFIFQGFEESKEPSNNLNLESRNIVEKQKISCVAQLDKTIEKSI